MEFYIRVSDVYPAPHNHGLPHIPPYVFLMKSCMCYAVILSHVPVDVVHAFVSRLLVLVFTSFSLSSPLCILIYSALSVNKYLNMDLLMLQTETVFLFINPGYGSGSTITRLIRTVITVNKVDVGVILSS